MWASPLCQTFLHLLYDKEILEEALILQWYSRKPTGGEDGSFEPQRKLLRQQVSLLLDECNCFLVLPFPRWYVPNFAFASLLRFVFINCIPNSVPNTTLLLRNYLSKVCCLWWRFHWIIINTNQRIAKKSPVVVCLCFIILFLTDFSLYHVVTRGRGGEWWWCWRWRRGMKHFNRKESSKKI